MTSVCSAMPAMAISTSMPAKKAPVKTFKEETERFMHALYAKASELGGQISGEHGIGLGKRAYLAENLGPLPIALMQGIKLVFDPDLILNPNKVCF